VAGSLDVPELERRVALVAAAQTREAAAVAFADLPPLAPGPPPSPLPPGPPQPTLRPRWRRGHGDAERPGPAWRPTAERFRDPRTARVMRVWEDPAGGRHYVPDDES
jgi:hypothetical protein